MSENGLREVMMVQAMTLSSYITDLFGTMLILVLLLSGGWKIPTKHVESRTILVMIVATLAGCALDAVGWQLDGRPGTLCRTLYFLCNTVLFLLNIVIGPGFITIVVRQVNERLPRWHKSMIIAVSILEISLLIVNFFVPVVFSLDADNVYSRKGCYWVYIFIQVVLVAYGLFFYLGARVRGKLLRFFPAWIFFIPPLIAMIIQSSMYGTSLLWPSVGISFCGLILCLQQESIFLDKLTGVYNRYYMDEIKGQLLGRRKGKFAALMLDMNGFKEINDRFSHAEGDVALIAVANILLDTVGTNGTVIRFAGDEFVVLLENPREGIVEEYLGRILNALQAYNETSGKPYQLNAAIGGDTFDASKDDLSDFINKIDHRMYADKEKYYRVHNRRAIYTATDNGRNEGEQPGAKLDFADSGP